MDRRWVSSNTPWEAQVGYSRAVRMGDFICVSGTTASNENGKTIAIGDAAEQTRFVLKKVESTLIELGASMCDVVRTRMFVTNIDNWEEIGKAHAEFFADIRPAATMVEVSRLINPDHLIEIEVDAILSKETT